MKKWREWICKPVSTVVFIPLFFVSVVLADLSYTAKVNDILEEEDNELVRRMKELGISVPLGIAIGCEQLGWVKWKLVEYKVKDKEDLYAEGKPIAYVLSYISKEDMEKWNKGELIFNLEVKAELVFCHEHKRASHFRFFENGVERVIQLHEKNGRA